MKYSKDEVIQYVQEEDVKFIRLAFSDVFGNQKNIAIMPDELPHAFEYGIPFDASAIPGFSEISDGDLFLHPEPDTLMPLPWRPEHGRVVQMMSAITHPDGTPFVSDTRSYLKKAISFAAEKGYTFTIGQEMEFYLFKLDETGKPTSIPCDEAGYMDIAPEDRGENVRREICLTLEQMGIRPVSSHHEEGPGQNVVDFRFADPLFAADHAQVFKRVVKTVAARNGLSASFSPKPLENMPGNGFRIHLSLNPVGLSLTPSTSPTESHTFLSMAAGILANIRAMTLLLNPSRESYLRLGNHKAPRTLSWSKDRRSHLIRIPTVPGNTMCAELRSPDPLANPYLALALLIYAGIDGVEKKLMLPEAADALPSVSDALLRQCEALPASYAEACDVAASSAFINAVLPKEILSAYLHR